MKSLRTALLLAVLPLMGGCECNCVFDDVRTAIDSLPFTIDVSGSYYLTGNLSGGNGIDVSVDNVTIDLMGFTISGDSATDGYGIFMNNRTNVEVRNGTVRNFGNSGIYDDGLLASGHRVINVRILGNGTLNNTSGVHLKGANHRIQDCTAGDNGSHGLATFGDSILINNTAYNQVNGGIYGGHGATLTNNIAYNNHTGYGIYGGDGATLINNTAYDNQDGIHGGNGRHRCHRRPDCRRCCW